MIKIGIVGNGMIIQNAGEAMEACPEFKIEAIVCRPQSEEKARRYAEQFGIPRLYTDYGAFLRDPQISAVYIGIVNSEHFHYAEKALLAGKDVIVEKPFTLTEREAKTLKKLAEESGRILLEAIHLRYQPWMEAAAEGSRRIGPVRLIRCSYSKISSRYRRFLQGTVLPVFDPLLGGGALYDLGVYCIHFADAVMGERPEAVSYLPNFGKNGVDTSGILTLSYSGAAAACVCGKDSDGPCMAAIQGEDGFVEVEAFPRPDRVLLHRQGTTEVLWSREGREENPLLAEFREFARILSERDIPAARAGMEKSLRVMEILDRALGH